MINPRIEGNRLIVGKWASVNEDEISADDMKVVYMGTTPIGMLYDFLGIELHCTQQGASQLRYNGMLVYAVRMKDTSGASVEESTMVDVDGDTFTIGELDVNEKINWEALR